MGKGRPKLYSDAVDCSIRFPGVLQARLLAEATNKGLSFNAYVISLLEEEPKKNIVKLMNKIALAQEALR